MVPAIFKPIKDDTFEVGWGIQHIDTGEVLEMPSIIYDSLTGNYIDSEEILDRIETLQIALAGVTNSLARIPEHDYSYDRRSVLKTFSLKDNGTIDDTIDFYLESIAEYEKLHTIYMDRDRDGDDNTIHAYICTPKDGLLRSVFDKDIRLEARRNNIKYWVDDYTIESGSKGGKFIRPVSTPIEIM